MDDYLSKIDQSQMKNPKFQDIHKYSGLLNASLARLLILRSTQNDYCGQ
jgi:hypothetical protein